MLMTSSSIDKWLFFSFGTRLFIFFNVFFKLDCSFIYHLFFNFVFFNFTFFNLIFSNFIFLFLRNGFGRWDGRWEEGCGRCRRRFRNAKSMQVLQIWTNKQYIYINKICLPQTTWIRILPRIYMFTSLYD